MSDDFWIKYRIDCADRAGPDTDEHGAYEGFVLHAAEGTVEIGFRNASVAMGPCGLLAVSRSLIRLVTYPALYGLSARETVLDLEFMISSRCEGEKIHLTVWDGLKNILEFASTLDQALRVVGRYHFDLLRDLFAIYPTLRSHAHLLLAIPDAFPLAYEPRMLEGNQPPRV